VPGRVSRAPGLSRARGIGAPVAVVTQQNRQDWQRGHQKVTRPSGSRPWSAERTGVPQRRHGRPARPYTQVSSPRRCEPVVTWPNRSLLASSSRWARPTSAPRSATSPTGRHGRPNSPAYLCSGIAVCGMPDCGNPLHGRPRKNMKPYGDGSVRRQYWCGPSARGGCMRIAVDQRDLDEAAAALAIEILADPRHAAEIEAVAREVESEASRLDLAIAEAEGVAEALADRLGRGDITLTRYDIAVRPLDERIAKLKAERSALGGPSPRQPPRASREHWQRRWQDADPEERRALLKMALRGRRLIVGPATGTRAERADVTRRIRIE
jgi:hypothetical protein